MDVGPGTGVGDRVTPLFPAPTTPFRPLARLSNVVIALLTVHVVFDLAAVVVDVQMHSLLQRVRGGGAFTVEELSAHDDRMFWAGVLQTAGEVAVAVFFIAWVRRAYRNLASLGVRWLRFKPGWAVGAWLVPFVWFARPKSIVNDVWRASGAELPRDLHRPPEGGPVPSFVNWWWGLLLAGNWLYPIDVGSGTLPPSVDEAIRDVQRIAVADALFVAAGVLAIVTVRRITLRQAQRHAALSATAPSDAG